MASSRKPDFIPHKFREILVYGSTEWLADGKKKYARVFEQSEVSYLYCEFSFFNKLFDEEEWSVKVNLKCYELDNRFAKIKDICNIEVKRTVKPDENVVYIREGWGNAAPGTFWKKGRYIYEAWLDDVMIGSTYFYVENAGKVSTETNNYLTVDSLRLFEGTNQLPPAEQRTYYTQFDATDTRYIWGEVNVRNQHRNEEWYCELFFFFYNDARQLKGKTSEIFLIQPDKETFQVCSGWGSDHKGTWFADKCTLEIVFMEQLLAVVPFEVGVGFLTGEPVPLQLVQGAVIQHPAEKKEESLDEVMKELDELTGLQSIKARIREYTQYLNFLKIRREKGFDDPQKINLHAVFTGNPGTGKTTVALLLGKIYQKLGLLSKGHVHEVDRVDLVGEYIGQTAPKVKEAINKARGGVLFIDEAYALARSGDDSKDYGREVIEILLKEMSDGQGDMAVVVAGYPKEMTNFLESNPGLRSRFNLFFEFPDYVPQELQLISRLALSKRRVVLEPEAEKLLYDKLVEAYRNRDRTFGNARYVNGVIDEAKMNMGLRVMQSPDPEQLTEEELTTIRIGDLKKVFQKTDRVKADIPVDEDLLRESLAELHGMIGLRTVKQEIDEVVNLVKFYRETGKDVLNSFSFHTVFTGNPGTGKTTVARIMAKLFKALGLLEKGHLVECARQDLVAPFVGQTAIKTTEKINEAKGGVLFIDEAYALTQEGPGDYGREAVETLLKKMEDLRGQFIVIVAGYPENMRRFLESNPGLKSRFDKVIEFEDYDGEELYEIATGILAAASLKPDTQAEDHLRRYFRWCHANRDKYFGNGRSVRKVIEEAIKNQHLRMARMKREERTEAMIATLSYADVEEFKMDKESSTGKIGFGLGSAAGGGQRASSASGGDDKDANG